MGGVRTCVVLCFQVQVVQFVDVADVHLLFVQLSFVEVLMGVRKRREEASVNKKKLMRTYFFFFLRGTDCSMVDVQQYISAVTSDPSAYTPSAFTDGCICIRRVWAEGC